MRVLCSAALLLKLTDNNSARFIAFVGIAGILVIETC